MDKQLAEHPISPVTDTEQDESTEELLAFLEAAHQELHLTCDRTKLRRSLYESVSPAIGPSETEFGARLLHSSAAWQLRIDCLELTANEAVASIRPTAPIGRVWIDEQGQMAWVLIVEEHGSNLRAYQSSGSTTSSWLSLGELQSILGAAPSDRQTWIAVQPKLPCETHCDSHGPAATPLSRFIRLLAPERGDIGVILVFALVVGVLALSTPLAVEALVNTVAFGQFVQPVVVLALVLFAFLGFAAAMRVVQNYVAEIIQRRIYVRVAADLSHRLPRVDTEFWNSHYGPELINRFFEVITVQKVTTQLLLEGTSLVLQTLVGMAVIAFYHPIFLGFDIFLLLLVGVVIFVIGRGAVETSIAESRQKYATAAWLEELARHPLAFRSRGGLKFALDQVDRRVTDYLVARAAHFRILMRQIVASLALQVVASTVLLGLGGWLVIRGELTLGQLVAAELIVTVIIGSLAKIGKYLEGYYDVMAAIDKLGHLFDMPIDRHDGTELPRTEKGISLAIHDLTSDRLPNGAAIRHATLYLAAGEHAALIGPSANLRSLLLRTVIGWEKAEIGHVELDGCDVRRLRDDSIQDQVALVAHIEVFSGTIAENIHLGRADVTEVDIRTALRFVGLLDYVLDLPDGLATWLETDGRQLAYEQLVRLMLARAVAARPRLLLVDGLLDCLPDELVESVGTALGRALPTCTCLIATGRHDIADNLPTQITLTADGRLETPVVVQRPLASPAKTPNRR